MDMAELYNPNHQNTPQKQPRDVIEQVKVELKRLLGAVSENSRKFAAAALTIMTLSGTANAGESDMVIANNSTRNPSASVPTAEKGGGQVVEINGKSYTFAEIAALPGEKQVELLGRSEEKIQIKFGEYIIQLSQVANQEADEAAMRRKAESRRKEVEIAGEKAESKEADNSEKIKNIANEKVIDKQNQLIKGYRQYISQVSRTQKGDKKIINDILNSDFVPSDMKKQAQELMSDKNIRLI